MLPCSACDGAVEAVVQAYECLATLEGTSTLAQQALVGIKALNRDELRNLSVYFNRVHSLNRMLDTCLLSAFMVK